MSLKYQKPKEEEITTLRVWLKGVSQPMLLGLRSDVAKQWMKDFERVVKNERKAGFLGVRNTTLDRPEVIIRFDEIAAMEILA